MRLVLLVALLCFVTPSTARAEDEQTPPKPAAAEMKSADRVQLVEDDENGAIRFVIDGKEVGRFDAQGLHVDGPVTSDNSLVLPLEAIPDWNRHETGGAP